MTSQLEPVGSDPEEEEVDIDLDLLDEDLRKESVGESTTVKIGGVIIHVTHANSWPTSAMRAAARGDWEEWARQVIYDDTEFQAWADADLANYQVEAVFAECARTARLNSGKSARLSGSRKRSRRR